MRLKKDQSQHAFENEYQKVALLKKKVKEDAETKLINCINKNALKAVNFTRS